MPDSVVEPLKAVENMSNVQPISVPMTAVWGYGTNPQWSVWECALHQSLAWQDVLSHFFSGVCKRIAAVQGMRFLHPEYDWQWQCGEEAADCQLYRLVLSQQLLGQLVVYSRRALSDAEKQQLELCLRIVLLPLKHAEDFTWLRLQGRCDPVSRLPSGYRVQEAIGQWAALANRHRLPWVLWICHLPVEQVSALFGQHGLSELIPQVVAALRGTLRSTDNLYDLGEGRLAALLPMTDRSGAWQWAERLEQVFASASFAGSGSRTLRLTGRYKPLAEWFFPGEEESVEAFLARVFPLPCPQSSWGAQFAPI